MREKLKQLIVYPLNTNLEIIEKEVDFLKSNNIKFMYWIGIDKHHKIKLI